MHLLRCWFINYVRVLDVCFADPRPTCAVVTSRPIRGENVTLSCVMTYVNYGDDARVNPEATMTASIGWDSAAGTVLSTTTTKYFKSIRGQAVNIGATLQTDVQTLASGNEIPSYNCTAEFRFNESASSPFILALNSLSWTCMSRPVLLTWSNNLVPQLYTGTPCVPMFLVLLCGFLSKNCHFLSLQCENLS